MEPTARRASSDRTKRASAAPQPRGASSGAGSRASASSSAPRARQFQQKEGFSMLAPDKQMHKDLLRRQRLAEQARPKPKASEIRFSGVLDPTKAAQPDSAADREAARSRWVAEMQAKADPKEIRRQAREREEEKREQERVEEQAKRKTFDKEWYAREALRHEAQQQRTAEVNAQAKQHWAGLVLPGLQQSAPAAAEPMLPVPENVDFAAVRRKLAVERAGRGAAIVCSGSARHVAQDLQTPRSAAAPGLSARMASPTGAAALGLGTASGTPSESSLAAQCEYHSSAIIATQNAEYTVSLLNDQLKALHAQRAEVLSSSSRCREALDAALLRKQHLEQRLQRYGENPKFQAQLEDVVKSEESISKELSSAQHRLSSVEAEVEQLEQSLAAAAS